MGQIIEIFNSFNIVSRIMIILLFILIILLIVFSLIYAFRNENTQSEQALEFLD